MITFDRKIVILGMMVCISSWFLNGCATSNQQLIRAINEGNLEQAKQSLNSGADPAFGLEEAIQKKRVEIVRLLLDKGADPNKCEGWPPDYSELHCPLHKAVEMNQLEIVRLLLGHGADPNLGDHYILDDLFVVDPVTHERFAARYKIGAGPNISLAGIEFVLEDSAVKSRAEKVLKSGIRSFRYKIKRAGGNMPLQKAINNNHIEIIRALVESGAIVAKPHFDGLTFFCDGYTISHTQNQQLLYHLIQGYSFTTHNVVALGAEERGSCNIVKDGDAFRAYQIPVGGAIKIDSALDYARSKGSREVIQLLERAATMQKKH